MAYRYSNIEYTEMVRILARCDDNVSEACRQYATHFPNLSTPSRETMLAATQRLRDYGQFRHLMRDSGGPPRHKVATNPSSSEAESDFDPESYEGVGGTVRKRKSSRRCRSSVKSDHKQNGSQGSEKVSKGSEEESEKSESEKEGTEVSDSKGEEPDELKSKRGRPSGSVARGRKGPAAKMQKAAPAKRKPASPPAKKKGGKRVGRPAKKSKKDSDEESGEGNKEEEEEGREEEEKGREEEDNGREEEENKKEEKGNKMEEEVNGRDEEDKGREEEVNGRDEEEKGRKEELNGREEGGKSAAPTNEKAKRPPTDEEITEYVKQILEGADLDQLTMTSVCNQVCSHYPDFDLAHKKDFIKATVTLCL